LNAADYSPAVGEVLLALNPELVPRLDFHQGFLDLCFIIGVVPALVVVGLLAWGLLGVTLIERLAGNRENERTIALLGLGMIALSNCHDGYLSGTMFFFAVGGVVWVWMRGQVRAFYEPHTRARGGVRPGVSGSGG